MGNVILSLFIFLLFIGAGIFAIIILIDLLEYLKKYHPSQWQAISFERPFGIAQKNFFFYPVKPLRLLGFLFSPQNLNDTNIAVYKKRLKLSLLAMLILLIVYTAFSFFS